MATWETDSTAPNPGSEKLFIPIPDASTVNDCGILWRVLTGPLGGNAPMEAGKFRIVGSLQINAPKSVRYELRPGYGGDYDDMTTAKQEAEEYARADCQAMVDAVPSTT